ncbi:MAG: GreA/GreB family elongation factor [Bacteroidota bacterium]
MLNLKPLLLEKCIQLVETRLQSIQKQIKDIHESLNSETKSSAGDKHETGRAMIQLEREKLGERLAEIEKNQIILTKINSSQSAKSVGLGSLVFTNKANYFISVSLGEIEVNGTKFYAISSASPIGQALLGKKVNDNVEFRGQKFTMQDVC